MIISRNLEFFDKSGTNLNLKKIRQQTVSISDATGSGAVLEAITNSQGKIEKIIIINGGENYSNPTILIKDKNLSGNYSLQSNELIKLDNGKISEINLETNPANFTYPSLKYEGNLFFDLTSINLIENQHIFILEKFLNPNNNKTYYSYPKTSVSGSPYESKLNTYFKSENDEEIYLFDVDYNNKYPTISKQSSIYYNLEIDSNNDFTDKYVRKQVKSYNKSIQINLAISSKEEAIFERTLIIAEEINGVKYPFVEILLRGEIEGEDERFKVLLDNFGINIEEQEEKIFRNSDVNEILPNYSLLNQKRKEMLLEYHNIFSYLGSYKALVNIINYFDYFDIKLKEYWINVNEKSPEYKKIKQVEIPIQLNERGQNIDTSLLLPKTSFRKTSNFGLFFDINKHDGTYDEYGVPNVVDNFKFTIEEILIKLFALKDYLKERFLPLNARIIDITGEGIYFERYTLRIWNDKINRYDLLFKKDINFTTYPENLYIVDVTDYKDKALSLSILGEANKKDFVGNYINSDSYIDKKTTKIGCPITLETNSFEITWDEMNVSWDDLSYSDEDYLNIEFNTWNTVGQGEFYELEYIIEFENKKKYFYQIRDKINILKNFEIILPYIGTYKIIINAYDLNNFKITNNKEINIKLPNVKFISFTRFDNFIEKWDDANLTWDEISSNWVSPTKRHEVTWNDLNLTWDSLSISSYFNQEKILSNKNPKFIQTISERNKFEGNILNIENNKVEIEGQKKLPKILAGDLMFFLKAGVTKYFKVLNADYTTNENTILTFENLSNIDKTWKCYRQVKSIILDGDFVYNENSNPTGIKKGNFISLNPSSQSSIDAKISDFLYQGSDLAGIKINKQIQKKGGEFLEIYQKHNESINVSNVNGENKILKLSLDAFDKIIPGFSIIELTYNHINGTNKQRVLVTNISKDSLNTIINVSELDSDLSYNLNKTSSIDVYFKYNSFESKLTNNESGTSDELYLNFNYYNYPSIFVLSSPNTDWYIKYRNKSYSASLLVNNVGKIENKTIILVNDPNKLLYLCSPSYLINWQVFNENEALRRFGTNNLNWNNYDKITWDQLDKFKWDQLEYHDETLCYYKILDVNVGGTIQFNEEQEFQFQTINSVSTSYSKLQQFLDAIDELNNSESTSVNKFNYFLIQNNSIGSPNFSPDYSDMYILGVAKNAGKENLGYLIFDNGVKGEWDDISLSHTYPIGHFNNWIEPYKYGKQNSYINWNIVPQTYNNEGTNPIGEPGWYPSENVPKIYQSEQNFWESYRLQYKNAITGSFNWNDLFVNDDKSELPKYSTVFFVDDNCKIAGKSKRTWNIFKDNSLLIKTNKDFLIWTFVETGIYDIELKIEDNNGNSSSLKRKGFIKIL